MEKWVRDALLIDRGFQRIRTTEGMVYWQRIHREMTVIRQRDYAEKHDEPDGRIQLEDTLEANKQWAKNVAENPMIVWQ